MEEAKEVKDDLLLSFLEGVGVTGRVKTRNKGLYGQVCIIWDL